MRNASQAPVEARFVVNGIEHRALVEPWTLLVHFLREGLGLTGAHVGCVVSRCGACSVLLNGELVKSCCVLAVQASGCEIVTIEGLHGASGQDLHPLQEAFWEADAAECGFCTPGMIMAGEALMRSCDGPLTRRDIVRGLSGNLCRCTGYLNILDAITTCSARRLGLPATTSPTAEPSS